MKTNPLSSISRRRFLQTSTFDWLKTLHRSGHPLGNHTYDHVYVLAAKPEETQFRFRRAIQLGVEWAIEHQAVFDFLAHPSVLYLTDPEFQAIELTCNLVQKAGNRAALTDLDKIAGTALPLNRPRF